MSQSLDDVSNGSNYLSWKKLQLSKAKLKASSKTSALLSGFAMVAMVEMQIDKSSDEENGGDKCPVWLLVVFAVCTTLLVAVHMLALMISTCILPNIEVVSNLQNIDLVHESPHERLHWYIEIAWTFSTVIGLLLFLLEIGILCWMKFYHIKAAVWAATGLIIPVFIIFLVFAIHFYRILASHKYEVSRSNIKELELIGGQLEFNQWQSKNEINKWQGHIHVV